MGGNVSLGKAWGGHSREGEHQGPKVARLVDIECSQLIVNSAACRGLFKEKCMGLWLEEERRSW